MDIVDPHHHLWSRPDIGDYLLADLHADTDQTPAVSQTVFVECGAGYRTDGPEHLKVVGETEFVAGIAAASEAVRAESDGAKATIAGIVAHADLTLPIDQLDEVLDAHEAAGGGRFKGIRDALSSAAAASAAGGTDVPLLIPGGAEPGKAADADFRRGVAHLGERGLTYDTWHYHVQCDAFLDLARNVPGTTMVLDHLATPVGIGPFEGKHDEIFPVWKKDMIELSACENVVLKLGGLAMPDNGFGWHLDPAARPDVDTFVAAQERWYHHAIETFGPDRCMFESNFPVDKFSLDYGTYWDAMAVIADRYAVDEQAAMFAGTARRIYRLPAPA